MEGRGKKRMRAPNFSIDEKLRILYVIEKYKDVVENKKTDALTWQEKNAAWTKITAEVNSNGSVPRTVENIKGFFENQKRSTNKKAAVEKRQLRRTGGGSTTAIVDDPTFGITMEILNKKNIYGLQNLYDGDGDDLDPGNSKVDEQTFQGAASTCEEYEDTLQGPSINSKVENSTDWGNSCPAQLQAPMNPKLAALIDRQTQKQIEVPATPSTSTSFTNKKQENTSHSRRRPSLHSSTNVARKYEEVAEKKKTLYDIQISIFRKFQEQQEEMARNYQHDLEERRKHDEKIRSLQIQKEVLDIEIKKAQLIALRKGIENE